MRAKVARRSLIPDSAVVTAEVDRHAAGAAGCVESGMHVVPQWLAGRNAVAAERLRHRKQLGRYWLAGSCRYAADVGKVLLVMEPVLLELIDLMLMVNPLSLVVLELAHEAWNSLWATWETSCWCKKCIWW